MLAAQIAAIEQRGGKPEKGDDILLSVITNGQHAGIDMRFVLPAATNDDNNKLNALIANAHRIYRDTADRAYTDSVTGPSYPGRDADDLLRPGHGGGAADAGLLRLRLDPLGANPARRAGGRDRLHAGL